MAATPKDSTSSVFCDGGTNTAILVTTVEGQDKSQVMRFPDAHAALDWCIANGARFIFMPAPDHSGN